VNIRGVKSGTHVSNVFTVAKLLPLLVFVIAGMVLLGGRLAAPGFEAGGGAWLPALLLLVFAYGGFESALMPMAEVTNPRRDTPFALFVALLVCAVVYTLIHMVVMTALPDAAGHSRPVAEAARVFLGPVGATCIAVGALISMFGYLSGQFVSVPRLMYALGEHGDFPATLTAIHGTFRTPHVSIAVYAWLVWVLALYGSFTWNVVLSAVARLLTYGVVCAALLRLRRRDPLADAFRLPGGTLAALGGLGFCVLMLLQMNGEHLVILTLVSVIAAVNWAATRSRRARRH
jgi:amino acid transporter